MVLKLDINSINCYAALMIVGNETHICIIRSLVRHVVVKMAVCILTFLMR